MRLRRGPLADFLLEPHKVPVGVLDEELPDADLYIARPVPLLFGFDEDRPSCLCDALQRAVQIVDLNLKVDTLTKGNSRGPVAHVLPWSIWSSIRCALPRTR